MKNKVIRAVITLSAIILTAKLGRITYNGHIETYYNLPMQNVISNTDKALGLTDMAWIREDGCRMYGPWIILAADESVTRYSIVETSLGTGIVLDRHTTGDPNLYDLAVDW